jgi:multisubunit Na+/H+ antiporter MnhB subunit
MIFGASSIILFFLSFGIAIKEKSKITTILLIAGGAIIGTSVLGAVAMAKGYSKFLLGCSHNGLHHNGIGYIQKVSEKIILYLLFNRI